MQSVFACGLPYGLPASPSSVEKQHTHTHTHTHIHTQTGWTVCVCLWIPVRIASITVICRGTTHTHTHANTHKQVGQSVFACGFPYGLPASLASGVVSGLERSIPSPVGTRIYGAIQVRTQAESDPIKRSELSEDTSDTCVMLGV